jgi:hypothetical protein
MENALTRNEYESDQRSLWVEIHRIGDIVEGPPHPGLEKRVDTFLTKFETLEAQRDKQHKANTARLNVIIGILLVAAAYFTIWLSIHH